MKNSKLDYSHREILEYAKVEWKKHRVLIATATLGTIRIEWAHARYGQVIPINWGAQGYDLPYTAIGFSIDDAYNTITKRALELESEWLLFIEDDVILPPDCFIKMGQYMNKGKFPVVSGLYYTRAEPSEPLIFRGRGNGPYTKFKLGQLVWCDGLPMGCLLMHMSILKYFWDKLAPEYKLPDGTIGKKVFESPKKVWFDPENYSIERQEGTQDLYFFDRLLENNVLKKTGWKKLAKKKYPLLCDTSILCRHIDRNTGRMFPG